MDTAEHDAELRDATRDLLRRCDARGFARAAIHLEQAWLVLGGTHDPEWLREQIEMVSDELDRLGADSTGSEGQR